MHEPIEIQRPIEIPLPRLQSGRVDFPLTTPPLLLSYMRMIGEGCDRSN
jgi:hypothetical protein